MAPPGYKPPKTKTPAKPKAWKEPANWKQKTAARWAANHPPPLFPSTDISGKELRGVRQDAQTQVRQTYAASPMPALQTYLQPFADATTRNAALGQNYANYLASSATEAQNLSGAFGSALTGGIGSGQSMVSAAGGSGQPGAIPPAAQSLIPAASLGSSFSQYLNAQAPYVVASGQETQRQTNAASAKAAADYQAAATTRRQDIQDAISKLYQSNVSTLQDQRNTGYKNAVTSYLAMGKTAYQKAQLAQRGKQFDVSTGLKRDKLSLDKASLLERQSYHQASLDKKRTTAATKGIDLSKIYKTLFVSTPGKPGSAGATGPAGQSGGNYTIVETRTDSAGDPAGSSTVQQFVPYGKKVPKSVTFTNPDGTTVTRKVTLKGQVIPKAGAKGASTRKATPQSWDRAWIQIQAAYPDRSKYTLAYLKSLMPKRPGA